MTFRCMFPLFLGGWGGCVTYSFLVLTSKQAVLEKMFHRFTSIYLQLSEVTTASTCMNTQLQLSLKLQFKDCLLPFMHRWPHHLITSPWWTLHMPFIKNTNDKRTNGMVTPGGKCSDKFGNLMTASWLIWKYRNMFNGRRIISCSSSFL